MNKILNKLVWLIIPIPLIYLAIVWNTLPESIALHFDMNGNADRIGNKKELLISLVVISVVSLLVFLLLKNIYRIDPKKYAAENKDRLLRIGFAVSAFMAAIGCMIVYTGQHGSKGFAMGFILAGMGLLFAIIGNYLPNLKPNYFAGLRLPWTLENPDNWKKTHALAGKLWFAGGLFLAVICLLIPNKIALISFFIVTITITIIPCVYSYKLYRKQKEINASK